MITLGELTEKVGMWITGQLQLTSQNGIDSGLVIGEDAQIYRDSADLLRTPDSIKIDTNLILATGGPINELSDDETLADDSVTAVVTERAIKAFIAANSGVWPGPGEIKIGDTSYLSIQDAIDAASPGDVIKIGEGTYSEQLTIDKALTLFGLNKESTFIASGLYPTLITVSADDVYIYNIDIENSYSSGNNVAVDFLLDYTYLVFYNCRISSLAGGTGWDATGVQVGPDTFSLFIDCTVNGVSGLGVGHGVYCPVVSGFPVVELQSGVFFGTTSDVDGVNSGFYVYIYQAQFSGVIGTAATFYGEFLDEYGVTRYVAKPIPDAGDTIIWDAVNERWVPQPGTGGGGNSILPWLGGGI